VFAFRGTMVDGPVLAQAEAVVRLARAASTSG
jgi:citrate lyase beta subunit